MLHAARGHHRPQHSSHKSQQATTGRQLKIYVTRSGDGHNVPLDIHNHMCDANRMSDTGTALQKPSFCSSAASQTAFRIASGSAVSSGPNNDAVSCNASLTHSLQGRPTRLTKRSVVGTSVLGLNAAVRSGCPSGDRKILPRSCNCLLSKRLVARV